MESWGHRKTVQAHGDVDDNDDGTSTTISSSITITYRNTSATPPLIRNITTIKYDNNMAGGARPSCGPPASDNIRTSVPDTEDIRPLTTTTIMPTRDVVAVSVASMSVSVVVVSISSMSGKNRCGG
mmetsp:Transcript_44422/g.50170  ORF Transcript_44422/g.50170 Transcript_44422/m.50170 type:complete len:126 (-) Transcript_44422:791-1168(-)